MTAASRGTRVAVIWAPFAGTVVATRSRRVNLWEHAGTRRLNRLPDGLHAPLWAIMQAGSLAAPLVTAAGAALSGHRELAGRLAGSGLSAYLLARGVKRVVRRGRPSGVMTGVHVRGRPASGGGFISGHAAVSMALACEAYRSLGAAGWPLPVVLAPVIGTARVYVGAHLPLDVLGGAALGWATSRSLAVICAG